MMSFEWNVTMFGCVHKYQVCTRLGVSSNEHKVNLQAMVAIQLFRLTHFMLPILQQQFNVANLRQPHKLQAYKQRTRVSDTLLI